MLEICVCVCVWEGVRILLSRSGYVNHLEGHHNNQKQAKYANLSHLVNIYPCCLQIIIWPDKVHGGRQGGIQIQSTQSSRETLSVTYAWNLWNRMLVSKAMVGKTRRNPLQAMWRVRRRLSSKKDMAITTTYVGIQDEEY